MSHDKKNLLRIIKKQKEEIYALRSIISKLPGSIYWKNEQGQYLGCNDFVLEMAGSEQIIGKTDFDLPWKEQATSIRQVDQNVMKSNLPLELEEEATLANGQKIITLTRKVPLKDEKNNTIGILGVSVDITQRKKLELELKNAKERAEASAKAKTEFLENMRHDIRTPLAGITGFANLIKQEIKDAKIKEYVENLTASSHALLMLLNEILDVIKVSSGEIPLLKKKFSLKNKLSHVIELNQSLACTKNITLIFNYDAAIPPYIIGDSTRIHRIVLELITNALNFTHQGSVTLTVQLAKVRNRHLIIKLVVTDTGIGIAVEKQQEIFLEFKRLTPSYEGIYKGAGLGLALIKKFIDDLKGEIYVESLLGQGSQFTCVIPFKKPLLDDGLGSEDILPCFSSQTTHAINEKSPALTLTRLSTSDNLILIVEDQQLTAMIEKDILTSLNCQVDVARNGQEALQLVKENLYDLIFMDIGLPDSNGYEVSRQIRDYELRQDTHVPIIALSAHIDEENKQKSLQAGMNAVLAKPLNKEKAQDILKAFVFKNE